MTKGKGVFRLMTSIRDDIDTPTITKVWVVFQLWVGFNLVSKQNHRENYG